MSNTVVEFTKKELKSLIEDEKSCVHLKRCKYSLALYPCHLENFKDSIKELLNQKKARYEKELGGILLGYKNIKLLSSNGAIMNDTCHIHIDIEADFYVFKPEIGSVLKGIVNKVSEYHLGCLVHRLFNISVHKQDAGENWLGYYVDIGHEVVLNVTHIDLHSRLPFIRASLDEKQFENTNITKIRKNATNKEISNQNQDEITETTVGKNKNHKIENNLSLELYESNLGKHKKKRHKKSKEREQETEITELDNKYEETKKIKHQHKEKDETPEIQIENGDVEHKKHKKKRKSKDKDHDTEQFEVIKEKKDRKKSLEIIDQKQIKEENNLSIKKRDSFPNGIVKTDHQSLQKSKSFTDLSYHSPITAMADHEDRKTKKKRNSQSNTISTNNISIDDLKLDLHDSELEKLINDSSNKKKKKKKDKDRDESMMEENSFTETKSSKRKREEISNEEIVKKHKKKKRHSVMEET